MSEVCAAFSTVPGASVCSCSPKRLDIISWLIGTPREWSGKSKQSTEVFHFAQAGNLFNCCFCFEKIEEGEKDALTILTSV